MSESEAQTKVNRPDLRGRRLVIVSNRLPFNLAIEDGHVVFHPSAGGLVTGLASFQESREHDAALPSERLWVGWPGSSVDDSLRDQVTREALAKFQSYPVFLTEDQMEKFYLGFVTRRSGLCFIILRLTRSTRDRSGISTNRLTGCSPTLSGIFSALMTSSGSMTII